MICLVLVLLCLKMFARRAEKKDDHRVSTFVVVQLVLSLVVPMSLPVALGVLLFSTVSALEFTTVTWDAETSGKTVLVKPDWEKLMEQWNSGDRATTSVVAEVMGFRLIAPSVLGSLCVTCTVFKVSRS